MFMRMVYDEKLAQAAYLIGCQRTGEAVVIDPERDVDRYMDLAKANGLRLVATAETHIHADFLSGSRELGEQGAKVYVSDEGDADWKYEWLEQKSGGGAYDYALLHDGDTFSIGNIDFLAMHTPGHTPEHLSFLITDRGSGATAPIAMATGDFVFVGDLGRPDLLETAAGLSGAMEPAARQLFDTVGKLRDIPDFVQVWPAHGAGSACGKSLGAVPSSTIGYEKRFNPAILASETEQGFVDYILAGQPEPPLYFANMKRDNKRGPKILGCLPTPPQITVEQLRNLDANSVAIVDTRPWAAFRSGHINHSLSIPLRQSFNTDAGSFLSDEQEIYLIVEPTRVDEAVRDLVRVGLDRMSGWFDANELEQYRSNDTPLTTLAEVTPVEALAMLESPRVQVLDVRRATEFSDGHLPNAINVAHTRLAAHLDEVPRDKQLLVQCRTGVRSASSASFLKRMGYEVVNLKGGILAWEQMRDLAAG